MCCPLLLPSLGVGTPVVVAVDDTEGAESVGAFRSGRLIGAIRPVGVVGGKRNVPNWGDCRATPPRRALLGGGLVIPAVLKVKAWAPGVAAAIGPGDTLGAPVMM
jgi:hypothetical protein